MANLNLQTRVHVLVVHMNTITRNACINSVSDTQCTRAQNSIVAFCGFAQKNVFLEQERNFAQLLPRPFQLFWRQASVVGLVVKLPHRINLFWASVLFFLQGVNRSFNDNDDADARLALGFWNIDSRVVVVVANGGGGGDCGNDNVIEQFEEARSWCTSSSLSFPSPS
jgi:hypothetical protein